MHLLCDEFLLLSPFCMVPDPTVPKPSSPHVCSPSSLLLLLLLLLFCRTAKSLHFALTAFFFLAHLQLTQVLTSLHCIIWFRSCFSSWPLTDGWHKHTWHVDTNDTRWEYWWPTRQEKRVALGPPLAKSNYLCRWTITRIDALALLCHLGRFLTNW